MSTHINHSVVMLISTHLPLRVMQVCFLCPTEETEPLTTGNSQNSHIAHAGHRWESDRELINKGDNPPCSLLEASQGSFAELINKQEQKQTTPFPLCGAGLKIYLGAKLSCGGFAVWWELLCGVKRLLKETPESMHSFINVEWPWTQRFQN